MKRYKSTATVDQIDHSGGTTKLLEHENCHHSLLARTMKEILDAISCDREQLQHIKPWFWNLVDTDLKRQLVVECAIEGFQKAGLYTILEGGVFTIDEVVKRAPNAKKAEVPGVYARLYLAKRKSGLYVGSSGNIMSRMEGHDNKFLKRAVSTPEHTRELLENTIVFCATSTTIPLPSRTNRSAL